MIDDASRMNVVREALKSLKMETFWATTLWLKANVSLIFCPDNVFNHSLHMLALILMGPIKDCLVFIIIPCQPRFMFMLGSYA
jgi:hypothetical protein